MIWTLLGLWLAGSVGLVFGCVLASQKVQRLEQANTTLTLLVNRDIRRKALRLRERIKMTQHFHAEGRVVEVTVPEAHIPVFENPN